MHSSVHVGHLMVAPLLLQGLCTVFNRLAQSKHMRCPHIVSLGFVLTIRQTGQDISAMDNVVFTSLMLLNTVSTATQDSAMVVML